MFKSTCSIEHLRMAISVEACKINPISVISEKNNNKKAALSATNNTHSFEELSQATLTSKHPQILAIIKIVFCILR